MWALLGTFLLVMVIPACSAETTITPPNIDTRRPPVGTVLTVCLDTNLLRNFHLTGIGSQWCAPMTVGNLTLTNFVLSQERGYRFRIYQWRPCSLCQLLYAIDDRIYYRWKLVRAGEYPALPHMTTALKKVVFLFLFNLHYFQNTSWCLADHRTASQLVTTLRFIVSLGINLAYTTTPARFHNPKKFLYGYYWCKKMLLIFLMA